MASETGAVPEAEVVVLRRIGQMEGRATAPATLTEEDYSRLRALVVGRVVSTEDAFEGFEIIEIVPPDEPALVTDATVIEIA